MKQDKVYADEQKTRRLIEIIQEGMETTDAKNIDLLAACLSMVIRIAITGEIPKEVLLYNVNRHFDDAQAKFKANKEKEECACTD